MKFPKGEFPKKEIPRKRTPRKGRGPKIQNNFINIILNFLF